MQRMCIKNAEPGSSSQSDENGNICTSYVAIFASKKYFVVGDIGEMVKDDIGTKTESQIVICPRILLNYKELIAYS